MLHLARSAPYLTRDAPSHAVVAHRRGDMAQVAVICCGHRHSVERAKFTLSERDRSALAAMCYSKPTRQYRGRGRIRKCQATSPKNGPPRQPARLKSSWLLRCPPNVRHAPRLLKERPSPARAPLKLPRRSDNGSSTTTSSSAPANRRRSGDQLMLPCPEMRVQRVAPAWTPGTDTRQGRTR